MILLTDSDLHALSTALHARKCVTLTRTLGGAKVTARTIPAPDVWGCATLVQVRVESRWMDGVQTFESVEELRCGWKGDNGLFCQIG